MFSNFLQDKHSNLHFEGFAFFYFCLFNGQDYFVFQVLKTLIESSPMALFETLYILK